MTQYKDIKFMLFLEMKKSHVSLGSGKNEQKWGLNSLFSKKATQNSEAATRGVL